MRIRGTRLGRLITGTAVLTMAMGASPAEAAKLKTRTATVTVPPLSGGVRGEASATAICPRGTRIVGGGFQGFLDLMTGVNAFPYESYRLSQRRWRVSATNSSMEAAPLTAYAYCRHVPRVKQRSKSTFIPGGTFGGFGGVQAKCPRGTKAIAGGFRAQKLSSMPTAGALPQESRRVGARRWRATAVSVPPSGGSLVSIAYCLDVPKPTVRSGSTTSASPGAVTAVSPSCPRGSKPAAGGFSSTPVISMMGAFHFVIGSHRTGRVWEVNGARVGTAIPLTAYAYCS